LGTARKNKEIVKNKALKMENTQNYNQPPQGGNPIPPLPNSGQQGFQELPNATTTLVMGILSIAGCWFYGVISFVLAIIGLSMGAKGKKLYAQNPGLYTESSYKNLKAGHTMSLIGLILSSFWVLIIIIYVFAIIFAVKDSHAFDDLDFTNLMIMWR